MLWLNKRWIFYAKKNVTFIAVHSEKMSVYYLKIDLRVFDKMKNKIHRTAPFFFYWVSLSFESWAKFYDEINAEYMGEFIFRNENILLLSHRLTHDSVKYTRSSIHTVVYFK